MAGYGSLPYSRHNFIPLFTFTRQCSEERTFKRNVKVLKLVNLKYILKLQILQICKIVIYILNIYVNKKKFRMPLMAVFLPISKGR